MATSLVSVYENRFFILCQFQWKQKWAVGRRIWLIAHYVYFVVAYLPLFPLIPDQVEARKWLLQVFHNRFIIESQLASRHLLVYQITFTKSHSS